MSQSYKIQLVEEPAFNEVLEFLREFFFPNEPCARALDLCPHGYRIPALESDLIASMRRKMSLAAVMPDTREIIGVVICDVKKSKDGKESLTEEVEEEGRSRFLSRGLPERFLKLGKFFDDICSNYGQGSSFAALDAEEVFDIYIICTNPQLSRQGIGSALFEEALALAKRKGFRAAQCMALSSHTHNICSKFGFDDLYRIEYASYEQDGEKIFDTAKMGEHKEGKLMIKKLR